MRNSPLPSVKTIEDRLGWILEHEYGQDKVHAKALEIRKVLDGRIKVPIEECVGHRSERILHRINEILKGYGVEALMDEKYWQNGYWCSVYATYVNMGDTYATTILYCRDTERFYVTTWGDWIEWWENKGAKKYYD